MESARLPRMSTAGVVMVSCALRTRKRWEVPHLAESVDFRVDQDGQPWVLEINANPCLSPDAGFAAAVCEAGLTFEDAIRYVIADALR